MTLKVADAKEVQEAINNVSRALTDAVKIALNGHLDTGAKVTSVVIIQIHDDGNITTRIAGLVNKNQLFGACVEAILSVHEFDKAGADAKMLTSVMAQAEKFSTGERTDN